MNSSLPPAAPPATLHVSQLDGLRGVAALAVVLFHFLEFTSPTLAANRLEHAFLAVDFFFCLSGFVLASAYDARLPQLGRRAFLRRRLIRLHPLVVVGGVLGWLTLWLDPFGHLYATYARQTPQLLLTSCLLLPYPYVPERSFNLFPLNPPTWSLFWEYVASVAYALGLVRLRLPWLRAATLLAAGALCYEALAAGGLGGGWNGGTIAAGAIRVSYSFLAGLLVYRTGWRLRSGLGFGCLSAVLAAAFLVPFAPRTNWLVEPLLVLGYFPLLVALGAGATPPSPAVARLCRWLGDLSYPLYMVHYPFLWIFGSYVAAYHPAPGPTALLIGIATLAIGGFAYGVLIFIDEPLRRYLSQLGQAGHAGQRVKRGEAKRRPYSAR